MYSTELQLITIENKPDISKTFINKECQVTSLEFMQFFEDRHYRLVVMREKGKSEQLTIFTGDNCIYRRVLINEVRNIFSCRTSERIHFYQYHIPTVQQTTF